MTDSTADDDVPGDSQVAGWPAKRWRHLTGDMGNTKFHDEKNAGKIETVKQGKKLIVLTPPLTYLRSLAADQAAQIAAHEAASQRGAELVRKREKRPVKVKSPAAQPATE